MVLQQGRTASAKAVRQGRAVDRVNVGCTRTTQWSGSLRRALLLTDGVTETQSTMALPQASDHRHGILAAVPKQP